MKNPFLALLFALSIASPLFAQNEVVEDFIGDGSSGVFIDIEEKTNADFNVVDELNVHEKKVEESLYIPLRSTKPKPIVEAAPYTAQLKENSILVSLDGKKKVRVPRNMIVKAQEIVPGGKYVWVLGKEGQKLYTTDTYNALNINFVVDIEPKINPLTVYTDKPTYGSSSKEANFSHFFSFHLESITTNYYATLYRGERKSANSTTYQLKNYLMTKRFPFQVGFNIQAQLGYWEDPTLGTVTWNGLFFGPSVMKSFWQKDDSRWNFHLSAFRSLYHRSEKSPDKHTFSTLGLQGELEKEFDTDLGPLTLGVNYRWSKSSVKETSEYLENEPLKGDVAAFGIYLGYRFNWTL